MIIDTSSATTLSNELRENDSELTDRRRKIVLFTMLAMGAASAVGRFQLGIQKRLPEPPFNWMDSEKVAKAPHAYQLLRMPNSIMSLFSLSMTLMLASAGGKDRVRTMPWLPITLMAKVLFDAGMATRQVLEPWSRYRILCLWCLAKAAAIVLAIPFAAKEARLALLELKHRR